MELPVLEKEALLLSDRERALLADRLLASLSTESQALRQEWVRESEARLEAYRRGDLVSVDGPQAMDSLHTRFRG